MSAGSQCSRLVSDVPSVPWDGALQPEEADVTPGSSRQNRTEVKSTQDCLESWRIGCWCGDKNMYLGEEVCQVKSVRNETDSELQISNSSVAVNSSSLRISVWVFSTDLT